MIPEEEFSLLFRPTRLPPSEAVNVLSPACQSVERTWPGAGAKQGQIAAGSAAFFSSIYGEMY